MLLHARLLLLFLSSALYTQSLFLLQFCHVLFFVLAILPCRFPFSPFHTFSPPFVDYHFLSFHHLFVAPLTYFLFFSCLFFYSSSSSFDPYLVMPFPDFLALSSCP